jgi:hypothetical protein
MKTSSKYLCDEENEWDWLGTEERNVKPWAEDIEWIRSWDVNWGNEERI